ncbi:type VI secretion system contractile sheath large subunit [Vibrio atypicus]|uniref:type VI secretion system contractile sheath large subunit n=1 Tax=Vibrio atypicus TaxID=558271 RepID=UPI0037361BA3
MYEAVDVDWCAQSIVVDKFLETDDCFLALRMWLERENAVSKTKWTKNNLRPLLNRAIRDIDDRLNNQVNEIIHNDKFQQLEASWRSVKYLSNKSCENSHPTKCKVKLISLSWRELCRDVSRAIEFDQSELFNLLYNNEFNMPGGEPFGLIVGDYRVTHKVRPGHTTNDLTALQAITHSAAAAFVPFITGADASMFGVNQFSELASVRDIGSQFSQPEYAQWRSLRAMEDARFLCVTTPNILMREPYRQDGSRKESFRFHEQLRDSESDYLWGNAAYGLAAVAIRAYQESGWFSQMRGMQPGLYKHGLVCDIPNTQFAHSRNVRMPKPSVNLQVGDRLEAQLSDNGFIPVSTMPHTKHLVFYSNATVNLPKQYDKTSASVNARLSSMLQYILCVSRFAHYLKIMGRDKVGSFETAATIERDLQSWLHKYTTASDEASDEIRARYPLNEAKIQVRDRRDKPGHYYSIIHLRPHFQLDQMVSNIRLITELSPRFNQAG